MSPTAQIPPLQYVDRAVQTEPELCQAQDPLEADQRSSTLSPVTETEEMRELEMSCGAVSRTSTPFGSACSEPFDRSGTPSPEPTITTTTRVYKSLTSLGGTSGMTNVTTSRIVSLPETISRYSAKVAVQKSASRVVSTPMPPTGARKLLLGSPTESDDELLLFGTDGEEVSRIHVHSQVPESPHTPSPMSSPESIVIIGNNNHLADSFLRGDQMRVQKGARTDDQGWISWASSPPRPIPALHGPLSLPYARCPSGAEGTIIEEPDHLPRVIWGLEGEGSQASRSKDSISQQSGPTKSPARSTHRINKASVPPRLQLSASATPSDLGSQLMSLTIHETPETDSVSAAHGGGFQGQELVSYPLCGQEPIDLAELVRNEMQLTRSDISANNASRHSGDHRSGMLLNHRGNNWSNTPIVPNIMKDNNSLSAHNLVNHRVLQANRFSNAPGGPLGSYDADVSSQAFPAHQAHARDTSHSDERLTPRRQTALEIAQQYRQQQAQQQRQQQSGLPTPPNSSSPIWSSSFSPYPSSMVSPELLSNFSGLNKLSPSIVNPRCGNMLLDVSQQLGRGPLSALPDRQSEIDLLALASTAHLEDQHGLYAASPSLYGVSDSVEAYMRSQFRQPSNELQNALRRSPAVPRPPPNSPYTAMSRGHVVQHKLVPPSAMVTPPSPTSPQQPRTRSLSSQQNRSVPITRLIQRRLSAVPEEDGPSQMDDGHPNMNHPYSTYSEMQSLNLGLPADIQLSHLQYLPPLTGQHMRMRGVDARREAVRPAGLSSSSANGGFTDTDQQAVLVKSPATSTRRPAGPRNPRSDDRAYQERRNNLNDDSLNAGSARGRGQKRGGVRARGRGGRIPTVSAVNRPERVDGGLMVKS